MKTQNLSTIVLAAALAGCSTMPKKPAPSRNDGHVVLPEPEHKFDAATVKTFDKVEGYRIEAPVKRLLSTIAGIYDGSVEVKKTKNGMYDVKGTMELPDPAMLPRVYKEADTNHDKKITREEARILASKVYKEYAGKDAKVALQKFAEEPIIAPKAPEHLGMRVAQLVKANATEVAANRYNTSEFIFDGQTFGYKITFVDQNKNKKVDPADALLFDIAYAQKFKNGQPMTASYMDQGINGFVLGPGSKDKFNTLFEFEMNETSNGLAQTPTKEQVQRGYDALVKDVLKKFGKEK